MKIAIGCDHIVTSIKNEVISFLICKGHSVIDCGTYDATRTHYPIYGFEVARQIAIKNAELGIVICGTGVGITNSVNKTKGARCVLARDVLTAVVAKRDYDANVIGVGGRITGLGLIEEIVNAFINTKYEGKNTDLIKTIDAQIKNDNYDIHAMDAEIQKWENGFYTDGEKQDKIPLPKTWK